jgi:hypothetical protein
MATKSSRKCCSLEKKRLVKELRKCDFCTADYDEFHQCYREAAQESGQRSRACLVA